MWKYNLKGELESINYYFAKKSKSKKKLEK